MPLKHMWTSLLVMDITHDVFTMIVLSLLRALILYDKYCVTGAQGNHISCRFVICYASRDRHLKRVFGDRVGGFGDCMGE